MRKPQQVDVSRYIKKAVPTAKEQYIPKNTFLDFSFADQLQQNITFNGYTQPTPIQDQAIGYILNGKDVIGIAQTGTGKTAAFLLPLIQKAFVDRSNNVLIIAPTRELAVQIEKEFRIFSYRMGLHTALCIGGVSLGRQIEELRRHPQFVIGTPGRLKDLELQKRIDLSLFNNVVLDEVDRMLDMGFIRDISYILSRLRTERQSLFFSATVPPSVQQIMETFLHYPVTVSINATSVSENINQDIIKMNGKPKIEILHELLVKEEFQKVLLFGRTKWGIEKLYRELSTRGFRVAAIHGNKRQSQRQKALEQFRHDRIQILLATDVASRGIDIPNVSHVINYDLPETHEDYIHRIGRTGRADKYGTALTFVD
jgi:superfamily II DNA/RNA helicase